MKRASSSAGQSCRLITDWSRVRTLPGPPPRRSKVRFAPALFVFYKKRHPPAPLLLLFPTKLCFANFCGGPAAPRGRQKSVISLATIFFKNHRALILLLHLGLSAAAYAAVGLETRLRAQSPPHKILLCKLLRGPCRPERRLLKSSLCSGAFCFLQKTPSARSLAPPFPHETLLRKLLRGPRRPPGAAKKRHIACDDFFQKSSRAHSAAPSRPKCRRLRGGWPRNAPAGGTARTLNQEGPANKPGLPAFTLYCSAPTGRAGRAAAK